MIDTERLRAFHAVAAEKSFSKAAEKLFRTQPAISQAIRLLERDLGERLFLRLGRTTELTEAGRILLERATEAFETLAQARAHIEALSGLRKGTLTLSASDTTSCYVLPPVLGAFRRQYPGIEVRVRNCPSPIAAAQVAAREADIGVVTLPIDHPKLAAETLTAREDVAICAAKHPLAKRKRATLHDLAEYPLLLLDKGANTRAFIDRQFEASGLRPVIAMELGSIEVIKRLVELDFGVSIVPRIAVRDEIKRKTLHALRIFKKDESRLLGVVYPQKGIMSPAAQVFVKMLKQRLTLRPRL